MIVALKRELLQPNFQSLRHSFFMLVTWVPYILVGANISQPSVAFSGISRQFPNQLGSSIFLESTSNHGNRCL
jgi:hypothetical protein